MVKFREKVRKLEEQLMVNEGKIKQLSNELTEANCIFERFNAGSRSLDDILGVQRPTNDHSGLGYHVASSSQEKGSKVSQDKIKDVMSGNPVSSKKFQNQSKEVKSKPTINTVKSQVFVKMPEYIQRTAIGKFIPVCQYCGVKGHIRPNCFQLYDYPTHQHIHRSKTNAHKNRNDRNKHRLAHVNRDKPNVKSQVKTVSVKTVPIWVRRSDLRPCGNVSSNPLDDIGSFGGVDLAF